jgi:hypothetical protein
MGFVRNLTGKTAAKASVAAGELQSDAGIAAADSVGQAGAAASGLLGAAGSQATGLLGTAGTEAGGLFDQFRPLGQQGIEQAGFLTDPQAQFDFLQNNPLFQLGLDNANTQTNQFAAARGRLSAGDTLEQLNNNALLTASPLIQQQKQSIGDLINIGQNTAINQGGILTGTAANQGNVLTNIANSQANVLTGTAANQAGVLQNTAANQGNLLTGAAASQGAGLVGAANARGAGANNILNLGAQIGGFFAGGG